MKAKYEIEDSVSATWSQNNIMLLKVVNVLQVESWSVLVIKDEWITGRGFPIYHEVLGICLDSEKSGSAWENVG